MMQMPAVTPAAGAILALSIAFPTVTAKAAGPYDGTWVIEAPRDRSSSNANVFDPRGCEPVRFHVEVKDNQVSGNLEWAARGRANVESSHGGKGYPVTGRVEPDGSVTTQWEGIYATGKLTGNTGVIHWNATCGPRTATAQRVSAQ